jgi:hypothetical protein
VTLLPLSTAMPQFTCDEAVPAVPPTGPQPTVPGVSMVHTPGQPFTHMPPVKQATPVVPM